MDGMVYRRIAPRVLPGDWYLEGMLARSEPIRELLSSLPHRTSYFIAQWEQDDLSAKWTANGDPFLWTKEGFADAILDTADFQEDPSMDQKLFRRQPDQDLYRAHWGMHKEWINSVHRVLGSLPNPIGLVTATAIWLSPPGWIESTDFCMNRREKIAPMLRKLAASLAVSR